MSRYKVLVDSSVWIDYFKNGNYPELDFLIEEELACINELILTEIAPLLKKKKKDDLLEGLRAIEKIPLNIDWEIIRHYQLANLKTGINKVGIPDLIILQQVIDEKISLFSLDKHFRMMKEHLHFDLFNFNR
ncbi:MAG TPA: PIN domain nuclease [Balneolaceae bacterium]|nr:PIN domain nuclease [Balneola sp.]HBQ60015.1 PIN domain nuclease [Balneolaceae bacterium]|tara:strand:+ start:125247 stop:125642 length:396 start_codon:yes stop_codon:yes gene_type:complete